MGRTPQETPSQAHMVGSNRPALRRQASTYPIRFDWCALLPSAIALFQACLEFSGISHQCALTWNEMTSSWTGG